jgi:hypothetical protein
MLPASGPSSSTPLYQTDLGQTPLPEILVKIHRYKAPGVIDCRRGTELKRIFLDRGNVIFATTNQITESLGDRLVREGRLTQEQYDESVRLLKQTQKRHGVTLVEMGLLTHEELFVLVRDQIQDILWSVFTWSHGDVAFTPGRDKNLEFVKVEIPVPQAILQGVRRMPDARALVARLGTKATLFQRTNETVEGLTLNADEQHLLDTVDGKRPLVDLVNTPPLPASENARILYAFHALQLIEVHTPIKVQIPAPR